MQTRCKNHNNIIQKLKPQLQNLKTRFNRGAKNHNRASKNHDSQAQKHNIVYVPVTNRYSIALTLFTVMFAPCIFFFGNAYAEDTITITLPSSSVNLPITPTSSGVFNSTDINVQVTTSNTAGYTLSMTAADVNLTRTAAVNGTTPTIPTFTSLSGYTSGTTYSQANFPTGYWGYKLSSDTNYSPIASSITIADPDESTANTAISNVITFAAKLDNSKPAGNYTTTLTFTATGKTPPVSIISIDYDITLPSAEHVILVSGNDAMHDGYYGDVLADLGTGTHFAGTLQIEETALDLTVTRRNFAVIYSDSEYATVPSCTVGGDITLNSCGTISRASFYKVLGSGSIVVTVPDWD